jgi:hypothetical protein
MSVYAAKREAYGFSQERDGIRRQSERISDLFVGLTILFTAVGALVFVAGVSLQAPVFALSAAFAFASALAFALCAWRMARIGRPPRSRLAPVETMRRRPHFTLRKAA